MNDVHSPAHEEQLFGLCAGARDLRAAFEGSALSACAGCRELVDELAGVEGTLARAAEEERALERTARSAAPAPGEERAWIEIARRGADPAVAARGAARRSPRIRFAAPRIRFAAAAALAAALAAAWWIARPGEAPTRPLGGPSTDLGSASLPVEMLHPVGSVSRFAPFTWRAGLPPRGWFVVRVEGERDDGTPFRDESAHLLEARWDPADPEPASWPREVRWQVLVFDASGGIRASASASASRRDP